MEGAGVIQIHPNSRNGGKGTLEYLSKNNPQSSDTCYKMTVG